MDTERVAAEGGKEAARTHRGVAHLERPGFINGSHLYKSLWIDVAKAEGYAVLLCDEYVELWK